MGLHDLAVGRISLRMVWDFPEESPSVESLSKALSELVHYELPEALHFDAPTPLPEPHIEQPEAREFAADAVVIPQQIGPLGVATLSAIAIVADIADQMIFIKGSTSL